MQTSIAVATASGKVYYKLVSALRGQMIPFVTVTPDDTIPLNVGVVITTKSEKSRVRFPTILIYDEKMGSSFIIEEALKIIRGKSRYNNFVVGIDPGKEFGVAVIGDGAVLRTENISNEKETALEVLNLLKRYDSNRKTVKIGDGAELYRDGLIRQLDKLLPQETIMEFVKEAGTTKKVNMGLKRRSKDASSAIRISMRKGKMILRDKFEQSQS